MAALFMVSIFEAAVTKTREKQYSIHGEKYFGSRNVTRYGEIDILRSVTETFQQSDRGI